MDNDNYLFTQMIITTCGKRRSGKTMTLVYLAARFMTSHKVGILVMNSIQLAKFSAQLGDVTQKTQKRLADGTHRVGTCTLSMDMDELDNCDVILVDEMQFCDIRGDPSRIIQVCGKCPKITADEVYKDATCRKSKL